MEDGKFAFNIFTNKPIGKRPQGRPRPRRKVNIRINLKEIGVNTRNWIDSAQNRDYWNPCECGIELRVA